MHVAAERKKKSKDNWDNLLEKLINFKINRDRERRDNKNSEL